ncbi:hypothetical protein [Pedobacter alluvionis]|uniref:Uncharacterized protein n=1 Tax=Pedobacter alluvionis TaxID=475253 RepID=A0A497XLK7_9SPHI|nr:hypothetical protein [Pedobacter alluvionis]RLJ69580.1 hypothetical protein BCL90_5178 [Pedobacter alluvionis]TFB28359.1 hypothetical protein E3V97_23030 [Pedobacter alluvionis]
MIKTYKIFLAVILTIFLFSSCEKDGTNIIPKIKAINNEFSISGFVLGDTIEQYFDGVKMRDYYGKVRMTTSQQNQLAFEKDEINMELKSKSTGKVLYQQKFNINDKQNIVPGFYYDGITFRKGYQYPDPQGDDYTANFYVDKKGGSAPVDINIEVLEYYYDATKPDPLIVVNTTVIPIVENVKPGEWTPYVKVQVPMVTQQQSGTELYPIVVVRDSKTKDYYVNKSRDYSTINMEIPYFGVSPGKVQSINLNKIIGADKNFFLQSYDLVQIFPR